MVPPSLQCRHRLYRPYLLLMRTVSVRAPRSLDSAGPVSARDRVRLGHSTAGAIVLTVQPRRAVDVVASALLQTGKKVAVVGTGTDRPSSSHRINTDLGDHARHLLGEEPECEGIAATDVLAEEGAIPDSVCRKCARPLVGGTGSVVVDLHFGVEKDREARAVGAQREVEVL